MELYEVPMTEVTTLVDIIWADADKAVSELVTTRNAVASMVGIYMGQIGYDWRATEVTDVDAKIIMDVVLFTDADGVYQGPPTL